MPLITTEYDPHICQCCGADDRTGVLCVCNAYPDWMINEHGDAKCGTHKGELFLTPNRVTVAMGAPAMPLSHDPFRNYRNE